MNRGGTELDPGVTAWAGPQLGHRHLSCRADCFTSLCLIFLQLGMEAVPAHGLQEDVIESLCDSTVVFVS